MTLNDIRDYLLAAYRPKAILLHGSRAKGNAAEQSDYDIILVDPQITEVHPHAYKNAMLDISTATADKTVLTNANGVPYWPLQIMYDNEDIGEALQRRNETAYAKGPDALSDVELNNRINYLHRLIAKTEARGGDAAIRQHYISEFYIRVIRYWFERKNLWTLPPYQALPFIQEQDPLFFEKLSALWTENYRSAMKDIHRLLFDDK